jgi:hypothetical protein
MESTEPQPHDIINEKAFEKILPYLDPEDEGRIAVMDNGRLIGLFERRGAVHSAAAYLAGQGRWSTSATALIVRKPKLEGPGF